MKAIDPRPGDVILDGMGGYGAVSKSILTFTKKNFFKPEIFILDESSAQVGRAKKSIIDINEQHIIQADIRKTGFPDRKFDTVVIKMGVHEVSKKNRKKFLQKFIEL